MKSRVDTAQGKAEATIVPKPPSPHPLLPEWEDFRSRLTDILLTHPTISVPLVREVFEQSAQDFWLLPPEVRLPVLLHGGTHTRTTQGPRMEDAVPSIEFLPVYSDGFSLEIDPSHPFAQEWQRFRSSLVHALTNDPKASAPVMQAVMQKAREWVASLPLAIGLRVLLHDRNRQLQELQRLAPGVPVDIVPPSPESLRPAKHKQEAVLRAQRKHEREAKKREKEILQEQQRQEREVRQKALEQAAQEPKPVPLSKPTREVVKAEHLITCLLEKKGWSKEALPAKEFAMLHILFRHFRTIVPPASMCHEGYVMTQDECFTFARCLRNGLLAKTRYILKFHDSDGEDGWSLSGSL